MHRRLVVALTMLACGTRDESAASTASNFEKRPAKLRASASSTTAQSPPVGDYIVVLKGNGDPQVIAEQHGRAFGFEVSQLFRHALRGYAARIPAAALARVQADHDVLFVAQDRDFRLNVFCDEVTGNQEQCLPRGVNRIDGDASSTRSGDGGGTVPVNVAILDSGIDATHPDLNVAGGIDCTNNRPVVEQPATDPFGHGTFVAGLVGALDNGVGVVGVAPGARLWAARVVKKNGKIKDSSLLCAVDWVTSTRVDADPGNDIRIANMSIENEGTDDGNCGRSNHDPLHLAICNSVAAGVTYVVAAGNDAADLGGYVPAAYNEVLTATAMADFDGAPGGVGTIDPSWCGDASYFQDDVAALVMSNFATAADASHTIAAPGVCIESTLPFDHVAQTGYGIESGTSFSSPLVTGTVALCIHSGACSGLTPPQIVRKLVGDAAAYNNANPTYGFQGDPLRPIGDKYYGYLVRAGLY